MDHPSNDINPDLHLVGADDDDQPPERVRVKLREDRRGRFVCQVRITMPISVADVQAACEQMLAIAETYAPLVDSLAQLNGERDPENDAP
jgi:hypothetical protein